MHKIAHAMIAISVALLFSACPTPTATTTLNTTPTMARLVINEIDYDNPGADTAEFIEIYNGGAATDLAGYSIVLVNGFDGSVYSTIDLSPAGTIAAGQYLVIGSATALANSAVGALKLSLASGNDYLQNGSPDGIALVKTNPNALVDALSYGGSILNATISGLGTVSLVEGTVLSASITDSSTGTGSLCRNPNGTDSNNAATDWAFSSMVTPGAANIISP